MKKINEIIKDIKKINELNIADLENEIICAFENYQYMGENSVIVSRDESNQNIDIQAYIDHPNSPIICIQTLGDKVLDAWLN